MSTERCGCINDKGRKCQNPAWRSMRVFQAGIHPRVGTGWFRVVLCQNCFFKSDSAAIVNLKGRQKWRNL